MKTLTIIVTFNAMPWIEMCLDSLRRSTITPDFFIIDNGSTDGTQQFIREKFPDAELIQSNENLGFGRANNIGFQKALDEGYDYVYLLNQDAWVMPDTINTLIDIHKRNPEYGVLSPMQLQANEKHFDNNFLCNVLKLAQCGSNTFEEDLFFNRLKEVYDVNFVMAAHWLISRKCIETVGGFSPTFPHYGEDDNYLQRCQYWGFKIGIVPIAKAVHDRENRKYSDVRHQYISKYIEALKRASQPKDSIHIDKYIKAYIRGGILSRDKHLCRYAYRLFKERRQIIKNKEISMTQRMAFLNNNYD